MNLKKNKKIKYNRGEHTAIESIQVDILSK